MARNKIKTKIKFDTKEFDPIGAKPVGEAVGKAIDKATDTVLKSVEGFLSVTCKPLLEELGQLLRDKISTYRLNNLLSVFEKARGKLQYDLNDDKLTIHPRVAYPIIEHASMVDDNDLQEMWAGLFASSCNNENDDGNIIFIDILKRLTGGQVRFMSHLVKETSKSINIAKLPEHKQIGLIRAEILSMSVDEVSHVLRISDHLRINTEITALDNLGLIVIQRSYPNLEAIFERDNLIRVMPSFFLLQLFIKCQGSAASPLQYFLPGIYAEFSNKTKGIVDVKEHDFFDFLLERYELQQKYGVYLIKNEKDGSTFFKVDPAFDKLDQSKANEILLAYAICHWRNLDFGVNYPVKVRYTNENNVTDELRGSFGVKEGFKYK